MGAIPLERELRPAIQLLQPLQELDQRIWALKRTLAAVPGQLSGAQGARDAAAQVVAQAEAQVKQAQVLQKTKENELGSKEEAIKKAQGQLFQLKTNKEYTAMQHEIEGFKADRSVLEDEILALLDGVQAAQQGVTRQRAVLAKEDEALRAVKAQLDAQAQQLQQELDGLQGRRSQLVAQVPAKILSVYERILANKNGMALVPIRQEACGGCNMVVTPQVIHEVRMGEKLLSCDSCARLLYWTGENHT